jgi:chromosome transmission fidelity protein 18
MDNLLDAPIHRLMEQVSEDAARKLLRSDAAIATASTTSTDAPEDTLWVDRYRPKRFLDLIGDERVHRETLAWVKEWDFCVFGKRKGKGVKRAWEGDEAKDDDDGEWKKDEFQRPKERILLLSGPAGLGKTTLAHVVARQAGYRVFEINARSVASLDADSISQSMPVTLVRARSSRTGYDLLWNPVAELAPPSPPWSSSMRLTAPRALETRCVSCFSVPVA